MTIFIYHSLNCSQKGPVLFALQPTYPLSFVWIVYYIQYFLIWLSDIGMVNTSIRAVTFPESRDKKLPSFQDRYSSRQQVRFDLKSKHRPMRDGPRTTLCDVIKCVMCNCSTVRSARRKGADGIWKKDNARSLQGPQGFGSRSSTHTHRSVSPNHRRHSVTRACHVKYVW